MRAEACWHIALRQRLVSAEGGPNRGGRPFVLDVAFNAAAPRVALVGPSGSGKTQLLKLIAGLGRPDAGRIAVAGRVLLDLAAGVAVPAAQRRMGYLPQSHALFPHLTVAQNVAFAARRAWRTPRRLDALAAHWLDVLELTPLAAQRPHQLSGGQAQRVALARALVSEPAALLLDEPFAALDAVLRERLREEIAVLQRRLSLPLCLVSHDAADVAALADEVFTLRDGHLVPG